MSKLAILIDLLMKGPASSITLMEKTRYGSKAALANALAEIPGVRRILVDAGCRNIMVYWVEGELEQKRKLRHLIPEVLRLREEKGLTVKEAMRELNIEVKPNTVDKAIRDFRKRSNAA